ncbi:MAG TPA: ABC transporter permease [Candidatus Methanoperedens sp.]|nr:ABC transporter permease [Candidatus Methanoperedens sp.]
MWDGVRGVLYRELKVFSKHARKQILASSVSPLLFLVAFGWGFGRGVTMEGVPYLTFLIPGLIAMSSLNQSYGIAQELNISRFYFHIFDEFLIAPVTPFGIVFGETLYGMFRGLVSAALILLIALLFGVPFTPTLLFFAALAIHTFIFASLGVALAMLVQDHAGQAAVTNFVITPMIFLGGTFFSLERLPAQLKLAVSLLPLSHSVRVIRDTFLGRAADPVHFGVLTLFAGGFFVLAHHVVKRVEA